MAAAVSEDRECRGPRGVGGELAAAWQRQVSKRRHRQQTAQSGRIIYNAELVHMLALHQAGCGCSKSAPCGQSLLPNRCSTAAPHLSRSQPPHTPGTWLTS